MFRQCYSVEQFLLTNFALKGLLMSQAVLPQSRLRREYLVANAAVERSSVGLHVEIQAIH